MDELPQDSQATEVMEDVLEEYDSQATEEFFLSNSEEDHSSSSEPLVAAPDEAKSDGPMVMCPCESMTGTRSQRYMPYSPQLASTLLQEIHQENRCTRCEEPIQNHDYCEKYQEWFCKTVFEPCIAVGEPRSFMRSFIQRNLEEDRDMYPHGTDSNVETYTDLRQEFVKAQQAGIEWANQAWESHTTQQANTPSVQVVCDNTNSDDKSEPDSQATQDCFADSEEEDDSVHAFEAFFRGRLGRQDYTSIYDSLRLSDPRSVQRRNAKKRKNGTIPEEDMDMYPHGTDS